MVWMSPAAQEPERFHHISELLASRVNGANKEHFDQQPVTMAPLNRIKAAEKNEKKVMVPKIRELYDRAPAQKILDKTMRMANYAQSLKRSPEDCQKGKKRGQAAEDTVSEEASYGYVFEDV